jgi:galactose mutarotase-like enzyme
MNRSQKLHNTGPKLESYGHRHILDKEGKDAPLKILAAAACGLAILAAWPDYALASASGSITKERLVGAAPGLPIYTYKLTNAKGMSIEILNYGGIVVSLRVPDRDGRLDDIVLGYADPADYVRTGNKPYFGALIGRYAGRIANGRLPLEGSVYRLSVNEGRNTLHGGKRGFDKRIWQAEERRTDGAVGLALQYVSKDGEEGFPGTLTANVQYTLTDGNELRIDYAAVTDRKTVVNLSQHNYYNLKGAGNGDILGHVLTVHASRFTPVDKELIPTGEIRSVAGTALDFRKPDAIGARIRSSEPQMRYAGGYDFNYVLDRAGPSMMLAATVVEPISGRRMDVYTTQPGLQVYSGNQLDGTDIGKEGKRYGRYYGFCLETQHFPDSPHHPNFPSTELAPGRTYRQTSVFRFSVVKMSRH